MGGKSSNSTRKTTQFLEVQSFNKQGSISREWESQCNTGSLEMSTDLTLYPSALGSAQDLNNG